MAKKRRPTEPGRQASSGHAKQAEHKPKSAPTESHEADLEQEEEPRLHSRLVADFIKLAYQASATYDTHSFFGDLSRTGKQLFGAHWEVPIMPNSVSRLDRAAFFEALSSAVYSLESTYTLTVDSDGRFTNTPRGEVVINERNRHLVTQVAPDSEPHPFFDTVVETASTQLDIIRQSDDAKVGVYSNEHICIVHIDAGQHKERIAVTADGHFLYQHHPSSYERDNNRTERSKYVRLGFSYPAISDAPSREERSIVAIGEQRVNNIEQVIRLGFSVKDLDFVTGDRAVKAGHHLFKNGATNIRFLLATIEATNAHIPPGYLPEREQQLVDKIRAVREELNAFRERTRAQLEHLDRAKDLNYEILRQLHVMPPKAELVYARQPMDRSATDLHTDVMHIIEMIETMQAEMGQAATGPIYDLKTHTLRERLERFAAIADTLTFAEGAQERASAYRAFQSFFSDNMGPVVDLARVASAQDAVRFLHYHMYRKQMACADDFRTLSQRGASVDPFWPSLAGETAAVLDATTSGIQHSTTGRVFAETYQALSPTARGTDHVFTDTTYQKPPVVVIGDDHMEMTLSAGKHFVEVSADAKEADKGYAVVFRWAQKGYPGAEIRSQFMNQVLSELGFQLNHGEGVQTYIYRGSDAIVWQDILSETIRLAYAMKDIDLMKGDSPEYITDLFFDGVTNVARLLRYIAVIADTEEWSPVDIATSIRVTLNVGSHTEQEYVLGLLVNRGDTEEQYAEVCSSLAPAERNSLLELCLGLQSDSDIDASKLQVLIDAIE